MLFRSKQERLRRLQALLDAQALEISRGMVGSVQRVLVERAAKKGAAKKAAPKKAAKKKSAAKRSSAKKK